LAEAAERRIGDLTDSTFENYSFTLRCNDRETGTSGPNLGTMGLLATHPSPNVTLNASSFSPLITRIHVGVEEGATRVNAGLKKTKKRGIAAARVSHPIPHFLVRTYLNFSNSP
jgi:hypothetical protein